MVSFIAKQKNESGIKGLSLTGAGFLNSKRGYYLEGFFTKINKASKKDLYNAEKYGLELVSRYEKIDLKLLQLKKIDQKGTISTTTEIYQVRTGAMINGKLYITAQVLSENYITIMYNYRYRTTSRDFFNIHDSLDSRVTHKNPGYGKGRKIGKKKVSRKVQLHENKQENIRRKYKER